MTYLSGLGLAPEERHVYSVGSPKIIFAPEERNIRLPPIEATLRSSGAPFQIYVLGYKHLAPPEQYQVNQLYQYPCERIAARAADNELLRRLFLKRVRMSQTR